MRMAPAWPRSTEEMKMKKSGHMIKCLLTELSGAKWENIGLSVKMHGPRAKYFPVRPSHSVNKYIEFLLPVTFS